MNNAREIGIQRQEIEETTPTEIFWKGQSLFDGSMALVGEYPLDTYN